MFISEECGDLKYSLMVESLLEIMAERGSQKFYKPIYVHSLTNAIKEIWGKYDVSCGYIFRG